MSSLAAACLVATWLIAPVPHSLKIASETVCGQGVSQ